MIELYIGIGIGFIIGIILLIFYIKTSGTDFIIFRDTSKLSIGCLEKILVMASELHQVVSEAEDHLGAKIVVKYGNTERGPKAEAIRMVRWVKGTYTELQPMLARYFELTKLDDIPLMSPHLVEFMDEFLEENK